MYRYLLGTYNRVIVIGNGFDRALGLKTGYKDFILDLLFFFIKEQEISILFEIDRNRKDHYIDKFLKVLDASGYQEVKGDILNLIANRTIKGKSDFTKRILDSIIDKGWVDIEEDYFESLRKLVEKANVDKVKEKDISAHVRSVRNLNNELQVLTNSLESYLSKEVESFDVTSQELYYEDFIERLTGYPVIKKPSFSDSEKPQKPERIILLNFNYTTCLSQLIRRVCDDTVQIIDINIHGLIGNELHGPIFGYGNNYSEQYDKIEGLNENEFLSGIKSFKYNRSPAYNNLIDYLSTAFFEVYLVGHSCGMSDHTMFKTIFDHDNCKLIKSYHFSLSNKTMNPTQFRRECLQDHTDKWMNLSRHFTDKSRMQSILQSFDEKDYIPQI